MLEELLPTWDSALVDSRLGRAGSFCLRQRSLCIAEGGRWLTIDYPSVYSPKPYRVEK